MIVAIFLWILKDARGLWNAANARSVPDPVSSQDGSGSCTESPPSLRMITLGSLLRGQSDRILESAFARCEKKGELQLLDALAFCSHVGLVRLYCSRLVGWVDVKFPRAGFLLAPGRGTYFLISRSRFFTVALRGQLTCRASHS